MVEIENAGMPLEPRGAVAGPIVFGAPWLREDKGSDRKLVRRAQSGSSDAFNALVHKYRHQVLKLTLRYMRNHADAEDVVQETFLKAYGALRHFRGECAFYSWLYRIAINVAKTAIQLRSREAMLFALEAPEAERGDDKMRARDLDTPEDMALTEEICGAVNAAIDALCDEQRHAIVLREFNGLSYQEMAVAMSCPIGTVRSRVFRAREAIDVRVRRLFGDEWRRRRPPLSSPDRIRLDMRATASNRCT